MFRYGTLRNGVVTFPSSGQVLVPVDDNGDPVGGNFVTSEDITTIVKCTQAEYDALPSPDAQTLYVVVG